MSEVPQWAHYQSWNGDKISSWGVMEPYWSLGQKKNIDHTEPVFKYVNSLIFI